MQSYEVLKRAIESVGVKAVAASLRLSPAMVYKWCQPHDPEDPDTSGARNPLDRLAGIAATTGDTCLINWLCHEGGGFYVPNPRERVPSLNTELLNRTQRLVTEFSQLLMTVTAAIENDGAIQPDEADRIRQAWELLKASGEAFTTACERGHYGNTGYRLRNAE